MALRAYDPAGAARFRELIASRRTVRDFSTEPVDPQIIRDAVAAANTAPSGANRQPWRFVVVADADAKQRIRDGAEAEERAFYDSRASQEWLEALAPLGTDWRKPHLTAAPLLIVVFEVHRPKPYYVKESVGIAVGFLLAALHASGLATLTHTPSPMRFLNAILDRPGEERPHLLVAVGRPARGATVPVLERKTPDEVTVWVE
ncbi:MAG: nitroreductase family protein [Actinomycetota bacterium]|nr:nitroreductase family protein [Actinomycetota bacterium]